jgi:dihydrofolate synthase/folylpolyglutamate synthase
MASAPKTADAILERLKSLHPRAIDLSLDRIRGLLDRLGNPERHLPPVVHVAGTNGKGSLCAYLAAMTEAAGRRVHVYTSPHLVRFNERIRLAGTDIEDGPLIAYLEEAERANAGASITQFEITTAAAFLAFARVPADLLVLETGLGGRLDATNVVDRPACVGLTPISFDHTQYLGDTLTAIAGEKAGIMKPGVPAVIGPQGPEATAVFDAKGLALGCPLYRHGREWTAEAGDGVMVYRGERTHGRLPLPALVGAHQILNAGTAIACLEAAPALAVPDRAIAEGLVRVRWPARMQRLARGPLVERLPAGGELWLDGGHNGGCGEVVAATAAEWARSAPALPLHLVLGMINTKHPDEYLAPFAARRGLVSSVRALRIPGEPNAWDAKTLADAARAAGMAATEVPSVEAAFDGLIAGARGPSRILICGSLYLAGRVLAENG